MPNIMMKMITVLLCTLANRVMSQTKDTSPAKILAQQKTISENDDLYVTCSTFGRKKNSTIFVYLWKDGHGIKKNMQKQDQNDVTFSISRVNLHYSGNYSCGYSHKNYTLSEVAETGSNIIQILVIANFLPAHISVDGPSTVHEGDHVEFSCTVSDTLHTLGECQLIHSYLRKNETILQVQAFNVTRRVVKFTIEGAVMRDSGHYSCMVLPSKCIQEHKNTPYGKNTVLLEVTVDLVPRAIVSCGVVALMLLLGLSLWWISNKQGCSVVCNPSTTSQQTKREDVEAQDEEDNIEKEEDSSADLSDYDDCEDVYSVPDDLPGRSHLSGLYASASKNKQ